MKTVFIKNLSPEKIQKIQNLVSSWDDFDVKKDFSLKNTVSSSVLFLNEKQYDEIQDFKDNLLFYYFYKNIGSPKKDIIYREKIHPMFKTIVCLVLNNSIKYNKKLITDQQIEVLVIDAISNCFMGLEHFDPINHSSPEYYFYKLSLNFFFQNIRRLEKEAKLRLNIKDENEIEELLNELIHSQEKNNFDLESLREFLDYRINNIKYTEKTIKERRVIEVLRNIENISLSENLNKKILLEEIRTRTGLNTKQIHKVLNNLKKFHDTWNRIRNKK